MAYQLSKHKLSYYKCLDSKARYIANKLIECKTVTSLILKYTSELYCAAQTETVFSDDNFQSAYHQPITSDFEFLIARIFFHYSKRKRLGRVISLRKQKKDKKSNQVVAPDIKIEKGKSIIAIIEIKAKAGWMQPFFSDDRRKRDIAKGLNPDALIKKSRDQLLKYASLDYCGKNKVFLLLPSFVHVHRKKYEKKANDYRKTFAKNSTLRKKNLILLSENTSLDLAAEFDPKCASATDNFENFIRGLVTK